MKHFIYGFIIAAFIFTGLGYSWHYHQVTDRHKAEISKLEERVLYYRTHWSPVKEKKIKEFYKKTK